MKLLEDIEERHGRDTAKLVRAGLLSLENEWFSKHDETLGANLKHLLGWLVVRILTDHDGGYEYGCGDSIKKRGEAY